MSKADVVDVTSIAPGSRRLIKAPVSVDLHGGDINLWIHAVRGKTDGPVLSILSSLHGSEWLSIEVVRRVLERLDPATLKGTVLSVPVGNPVALNHLTRNTPDEADASDLNRVFPGRNNWMAELLAANITEHVLKQSDFLIDMHLAPWGAAMGATAWAQDFPDSEVVRVSGEMARDYGYPVIHKLNVVTQFPGPSSAGGYAGAVLGVPTLLVEVGGVGFSQELEEEWIEQNVRGILGVLQGRGMLPGNPPRCEKYLYFTKARRLDPSVAGYLQPVVPVTELGKPVRKGKVLAKVISPYTFEELEVLQSPVDGYLLYAARPYPVRPGYWSYGVIDAEDENTVWES